jgi:hypothetical protein
LFDHDLGPNFCLHVPSDARRVEAITTCEVGRRGELAGRDGASRVERNAALGVPAIDFLALAGQNDLRLGGRKPDQLITMVMFSEMSGIDSV